MEMSGGIMPCSEPLFKVRPYLNATTEYLYGYFRSNKFCPNVLKYSRTPYVPLCLR